MRWCLQRRNIAFIMAIISLINFARLSLLALKRQIPGTVVYPARNLSRPATKSKSSLIALFKSGTEVFSDTRAGDRLFGEGVRAPFLEIVSST